MSTAEPMECDPVPVSPTTLSPTTLNSHPLLLPDPEPANPSSRKNSETSSVELDRSADDEPSDGTSTAFQLQRSADEPTADDGLSTALPSPPTNIDPHQN